MGHSRDPAGILELALRQEPGDARRVVKEPFPANWPLLQASSPSAYPPRGMRSRFPRENTAALAGVMGGEPFHAPPLGPPSGSQRIVELPTNSDDVLVGVQNPEGMFGRI